MPNFSDTIAELWEYEEWDIDNPTWSGNPFDLEAEVTFQHQESGETITTPMFYDNNNIWSFRFTGTQLGTWTFTTASTDPDLNGLTGSVTVNPNDDPKAYGFMVPSSVDPQKWARQIGNQGREQVFVPQLLMAGNVTRFADPNQIQADISQFIDGHGFTGFHVPEIGGRWFDFDASSEVTGDMQNPDTRTFVALENLIGQSRKAGAAVHIWAWGDQDRRQTPINLDGGINGAVDQRLQRYIAARLGPLPGWSMGLGFDLFEWVSIPELAEWHDNIQAQMGWFHFLGGRPEGPRSGTDHSEYEAWNTPQSYSSYEHHRPDYEVYVAAIEALPDKPTMSEDRFRIRDLARFADKDYDPEDTRRGLWRSTMAGGVANIWGNYLDDSDSENISDPYPNQAELKTYSRFFFDHARFLADMERANALTDGVALKTPDNQFFVAYKEDANSIQLDLSAMQGAQQVVAVNTKQAYSELDLGILNPEVHTITLPTNSDWAIAIGDFAARAAQDFPDIPDLVPSSPGTPDTPGTSDTPEAGLETNSDPTVTNIINPGSLSGLTLRGDGQRNRLIGGDGNDSLIGRGNNDLLIGGNGNDRLIGGRGRDRHRGGAGQDTFIYRFPDLRDPPDLILDFDVSQDKIDLSKVFGRRIFGSGNPQRYGRLIGSARGTAIQIDANGSLDGQEFVNLALLKQVAPRNLTVQNFIF
jgi:hypothetical protein